MPGRRGRYSRFAAPAIVIGILHRSMSAWPAAKITLPPTAADAVVIPHGLGAVHVRLEQLARHRFA
jgi:hypothetical protein